MSREIKACIFDLDGVLINTTTYHFESWVKLGKTIGFDFKEEDNEPLKGASRMHSLEIILDLAGQKKTEEEKIQLCELKNRWYLESIDSMTDDEVLPGVIPMLHSIHQAGLKMAVGSASKNARTILSQVGLADFFDQIVDGNDVVHGKPDPEVFLLAANRLGVNPNHCLVFEDAVKGIEAALRASMIAVGVGDESVLGDANLVISSFENLLWPQLQENISALSVQ